MAEYNFFERLIETDNLKELIILHENGILTREIIEKNKFGLFRYACFEEKLNICKWLYETFQINKEKALYNNLVFRWACQYNKLEICQWLYETFQITKEEALMYDNSAFRSAFENGRLKICVWLYETFQITKEEAMSCDNYAFRYACEEGHLEVCQWLYKTYQIIREEAMSFNTCAFRNACAFCNACYNNHYPIISFLCDTFGITEAEVKDIIKVFSKEKQEKILDCLIPFGSFTKPVK
jgi:hypothetical protein